MKDARSFKFPISNLKTIDVLFLFKIQTPPVFLECMSLQLILTLNNTSPISEQTVYVPGLCERTSRPFLKQFTRRYQHLVDLYSALTSQIIHDGIKTQILGTDVVFVFVYLSLTIITFAFILYLVLTIVNHCMFD